MPRRIIIDGYNLIRQSADLRRYDTQEIARGRAQLLQLLSAYRSCKGYSMTVVFDGWEAGGPTEHHSRESGIEVIYSRRGEKADEVIKRLVSQSRDELLVVTSDSALAHACGGRHCAVISSPQFEKRVACALYAKQNGGRDSDEPVAFFSSTKKKGPAKKPSKAKRRKLQQLNKL